MTQQPLSNSGGVGEGKPSHSQDIEEILDMVRSMCASAANTQRTREFNWRHLKPTMPELATAIESLVNEARIDENESIEITLLHEIEKPDHCYNHDKYVAQCYACREVRWRAKICKEYLKVLQVRIAELKAKPTTQLKEQ